MVTNAEPGRPISAALSWLAAEGADDEQTDGMLATGAIQWLDRHGDQPFFLAVGFFRPHTPFVAPRKYFELYPEASMRLPFSPDNDRDDIPLAAFAHNCAIPNYGLEPATLIEATRAYYASVSFVDAQIGRLLAALKASGLADKTLVVLWSDHGYHLGEHQGVWQKRTLFEESARSPLLIRMPGAGGMADRVGASSSSSISIRRCSRRLASMRRMMRRSMAGRWYRSWMTPIGRGNRSPSRRSFGRKTRG